MRPATAQLLRLAADRAGTMAIETALVAPVLATLALGVFEGGMIVSRQHELQTAAAESEIIVLAAVPGDGTTIETIKDIIESSISLDEDQVSVTRSYRCNADEARVSTAGQCSEDDVVSSYIRIHVQDTYVPVWTQFGIGGEIDLEVDRTVQVS